LTKAEPTDRAQTVQPTKELIDALYRDEVLRARRMSPEDKLMAGARLFDYACQIAAAGIRHQFAGIDEQRVHEILRQRLAWQRKLEARQLDSEYIYRWCDQHGTRGLLEDIRRAIPPLGDR
jgi:hypothetical protein